MRERRPKRPIPPRLRLCAAGFCRESGRHGPITLNPARFRVNLGLCFHATGSEPPSAGVSAVKRAALSAAVALALLSSPAPAQDGPAPDDCGTDPAAAPCPADTDTATETSRRLIDELQSSGELLTKKTFVLGTQGQGNRPSAERKSWTGGAGLGITSSYD